MNSKKVLFFFYLQTLFQNDHMQSLSIATRYENTLL